MKLFGYLGHLVAPNFEGCFRGDGHFGALCDWPCWLKGASVPSTGPVASHVPEMATDNQPGEFVEASVRLPVLPRMGTHPVPLLLLLVGMSPDGTQWQLAHQIQLIQPDGEVSIVQMIYTVQVTLAVNTTTGTRYLVGRGQAQ